MALTYLPSESLDTLQHVTLIARQLVEGAILGLHRSPWRGFSAEFAEYRKYVPGDNIRHIDWRTYARSDRFYLKCFEEETNLRNYILLDTSGSMAMGSAGDSTPSKFNYACYLTAAFLYLSHKQHDAATLSTWAAEISSWDECSTSPHQLNRHLEQLESLKPGGAANTARCLNQLAMRIHRRSMVILFSDFLRPFEEYAEALRHLSYKKCEIILFQILNQDEIDFPYRGMIRFKDMETGQILEIEGAAARDLYIEKMKKHHAIIQNFCNAHAIAFESLSTRTPFEHALMTYFAKRERLY